VLIVVRSASARNGRAAEALRAALGLAAAGHHLSVLLVEDGVLALSLGGDTERALATLGVLGHAVLVEAESLAARALPTPAGTTVVTRAALPALLEESDVVEAWR